MSPTPEPRRPSAHSSGATSGDPDIRAGFRKEIPGSDTPPGTIVHELRRAAGLTQGELARHASTTQPRISELENGTHDPSFNLVERLIAATGHRLMVVATDVPSLFECAAWAAEVVDGRPRDAARDRCLPTLVEIGRRLAAVEAPMRVALCLTRPGRTGDPYLDTFLAAMAEHRLGADDLPVPGWVPERGRHRFAPWCPDRSRWTPADLVTPFTVRGIYVTAAFLDGP